MKKIDLNTLVATFKAWKMKNLRWHHIVPILRHRNIWLAVGDNFRYLEGSWPRALKKMAKIFEGAPAPSAGGDSPEKGADRCRPQPLV